MKITIEAQPKEIADLVSLLQNRQDKFVSEDSSGMQYDSLAPSQKSNC